ncbi:MAG TPA: hypothetical protein VEC16_03435 [Alphaproteobacteria bacterium]|nr:hypothetical protein [Alphaproteobacteria bacterium]
METNAKIKLSSIDLYAWKWKKVKTCEDFFDSVPLIFPEQKIKNCTFWRSELLFDCGNCYSNNPTSQPEYIRTAPHFVEAHTFPAHDYKKTRVDSLFRFYYVSYDKEIYRGHMKFFQGEALDGNWRVLNKISDLNNLKEFSNMLSSYFDEVLGFNRVFANVFLNSNLPEETKRRFNEIKYLSEN